MSIIRNILVRVGADSRPLDKGLNDASKSLNNFSASQKKALYAMNANMKSLMAESKKSSSGIGEAFKQNSLASSVAFVALGSAVADVSAQMLASVKSFVSGGLAAFNSFEASNIGLESIVTGMGRDLGKAKSFIQAYIKDGLVPLSDATTSYKQLVARGYSDVQIQDILMRFKDSAAFARQGSLSMGEAIKGATEGLKNENSVLIDNAGVTENVSKMWEVYAKSIGVGANSLSKAQKRQAEYTGIMQATKFQIGDAAKYADTLGGKMLALDAQIVKVKTSFGTLIAPIVEMILPALKAFAIGIDSVINGINKLSAPLKYAIAGAVAGVLLFAGVAALAIPIVIGLTLAAAALDVALLPLIGTALLAGAAIVALGAAAGYFFGRSKMKEVLGGIDDKLKSVKKSFTKTKEEQDDFTESTKDSSKSIGKNIQSFDELNLLQEDTAKSLGDVNKFDLSLPDLSLSSMFDGIMNSFDSVKNKMKENPVIIPMKYDIGAPPTLPPPNIAFITSAIQSIETMIASLKSKAKVQIEIFANDYATPVFNSVYSTISNFATVTVPNALGQMANYMQNNWKPIVTGALLAVAAVVAFVFGGEIVAAVGLAVARIATFASTLIAEVPVLASATGSISNSFSIAMGAIGLSLAGAGVAVGKFSDETINKLNQIGISIATWSSNTTLNLANWSNASMDIITKFGISAQASTSQWTQNTAQNIATWSSNTILNIDNWSRKTSESIRTWIQGTSTGISLWTTNVLANFQIFSNDASKAINTFASNSWKTLGEWLSKTSTNIASWATSSIQTIVSWAQSAYSAIASLAGAVGAKINTGISWSANAIKSTFNDIGQWIGDNSNWIVPIAIGGLVVAGVAATGLTGGLAAPVAAGAIAAATSAAAVNAPKMSNIPELANGGIVTSPTLAQIGEAGKEAVIPLENSSFIDSMASKIGSAVLSAMQFNQPQQTGNGEVVVQIDSTKLARIMIPAIGREQGRIGNAIIQGV